MLPRYAPEIPLPPYRFVPGGDAPHPVRDRAGHSYGREEAEPVAPNGETWRRCRSYLRGIDLFNHGFWWEAHEAWEHAWIAAGRRGPQADFLKGLIHLAAAGVKALGDRPTGIARHARRAEELLAATAPGNNGRYFGLKLDSLLLFARGLSQVADCASALVRFNTEGILLLEEPPNDSATE